MRIFETTTEEFDREETAQRIASRVIALGKAKMRKLVYKDKHMYPHAFETSHKKVEDVLPVIRAFVEAAPVSARYWADHLETIEEEKSE